MADYYLWRDRPYRKRRGVSYDRYGNPKRYPFGKKKTTPKYRRKKSFLGFNL